MFPRNRFHINNYSTKLLQHGYLEEVDVSNIYRVFDLPRHIVNKFETFRITVHEDMLVVCIGILENEFKLLIEFTSSYGFYCSYYHTESLKSDSFNFFFHRLSDLIDSFRRLESEANFKFTTYLYLPFLLNYCLLRYET